MESLFPDKKNTHILTLCRTGYRSVQAANLLTAAGYKQVPNIWEGFVGNPEYGYDDATGAVKVPLQQLDLSTMTNLLMLIKMAGRTIRDCPRQPR